MSRGHRKTQKLKKALIEQLEQRLDEMPAEQRNTTLYHMQQQGFIQIRGKPMPPNPIIDGGGSVR